jgi:hypothetical protein
MRDRDRSQIVGLQHVGWMVVCLMLSFPGWGTCQEPDAGESASEPAAPVVETQEGEPAVQEPVYSGPQPGEVLPELAVWPLFGQGGDEPLAIVPGREEAVHVVVFVHQRTRPAFGVIRGVLVQARELEEKAQAALVFLTDDVAETRQWAENARRAIPGEGVSVGVSPDGIEGPGAWGLNRNVGLTVIVGRKGTVTASFAIVQPGAAADVPLIARAVAEAAGVDPPTDEQITAWTGNDRMSRGGNAEEVNIRPWLAPVIQRDADDVTINAAAARLEEAAGSDPALRDAVGAACRRVAESGKLENYGSATSQEWIRKWAAEWGGM